MASFAPIHHGTMVAFDAGHDSPNIIRGARAGERPIGVALSSIRPDGRVDVLLGGRLVSDGTNNITIDCGAPPPRPVETCCHHCGAERWKEGHCYYCGTERRR